MFNTKGIKTSSETFKTAQKKCQATSKAPLAPADHPLVDNHPLAVKVGHLQADTGHHPVQKEKAVDMEPGHSEPVELCRMEYRLKP